MNKENSTSASNKSLIRHLFEWIGSILIAFIILIVFRIIVGWPQQIASNSMESTLFSGDVVWVNRMKSPRLPMSWKNPFSKKIIPLSYKRLWQLPKLETNELVVFNNPKVHGYIDQGSLLLKRIIGTPGDTIEIVHKSVFINGRKLSLNKNMRQSYFIKTAEIPLNLQELSNEHGINSGGLIDVNHLYKLDLDSVQLSYIQSLSNVVSVELVMRDKGKTIQHENTYAGTAIKSWNIDNYGPIVIPLKNEEFILTVDNIGFFASISKYETNFPDSLLQATEFSPIEYQFDHQYYFVLGDNKDISIDSRNWGLLSEQHIIGTCNTIIFSKPDLVSFFDVNSWRTERIGSIE